MRKHVLVSLLILVIAVIITGCGGSSGGGNNDSTDPTYQFAPANDKFSVLVNDAVDLTITPSKEASGYTYAWSATTGSPTSGNSATFSWAAPGANNTSGTISAKVMKGSTEIAAKSWTVYVVNGGSVTITGFTAGAGATVQVLGAKTYSGTIDGSGNTSIDNVPQGYYFVRFALSGCAPFYSFIEHKNTTTNIKNDDIALWSWDTWESKAKVFKRTQATMWGKIYDNNKNKLAGATMSSTPAGGVTTYYGENLDKSTTDTDGAYAITFTDTNNTYTITPSCTGYSFNPVGLKISEPCVIKYEIDAN